MTRLGLDRVALRWKLTATAAVASCVALGVAAVLMLVTFRAGLLDGVRRDLRQSGHAIATILARRGPAALSSVPVEARLRGEGAVAQVIAPGGRVLLTSGAGPTLSLSAHPQPSASPLSLDHSDRGLVTETVRLPGGRRLVLARRFHDLDLADESLRTALVIGVPVVLVLVIGGAYLVSARALAPVERMRRRAERIGAAADATRLPVPASRDELADLGRTLNELLDRIAESAAHERTLIADAAHELRTPLARLQARLELAHGPAGTATAETLAGTLASVERDVARLSTLADDLLSLAALDAHHPPPREPIDLHELIDQAVAARAAQAAAAGRAISADTEAVVLVGDRSMLARAVANLLDNALVHGRGAIVVGLHRTPGAVEVEVEDEGDGLDLPLRRATERFTRGAAAQGRPGSGLGLALVKAVADAHGGTLSLRQRAFVLSLPDDAHRLSPGSHPTSASVPTR